MDEIRQRIRFIRVIGSVAKTIEVLRPLQLSTHRIPIPDDILRSLYEEPEALLARPDLLLYFPLFRYILKINRETFIQRMNTYRIPFIQIRIKLLEFAAHPTLRHLAVFLKKRKFNNVGKSLPQNLSQNFLSFVTGKFLRSSMEFNIPPLGIEEIKTVIDALKRSHETLRQ